MRRIPWAAQVLALGILSTSCGLSLRAARGPRGTFRVATAQPASLDPLFASTPAAALVARQLFDGLVRYDDTTGAVVPDMALSWEAGPDDTRFTFHLRSGARFSDGEPVTAASFVRGFTRGLAPARHDAPGSLGSQLDEIEGAAAVRQGVTSTLAGAAAPDERTLRITLSTPDAEFLTRAAGPAFVPVPPAATDPGAEAGWARAPVGNGPFRLAPGSSLAAGASLTLVPSAGHAGGVPTLAEVVLVFEPSVAAAYTDWQDGKVDWAPFPVSATASVLASGTRGYLERPSAELDYLVVTATLAPPALAALRQAVSLAIDRPALAASVFAGQAVVATGIVPASVPGSASNGGAHPCDSCAFDPARARGLLANSGFQGPLPVFQSPAAGQDALMRSVADSLHSVLGLAVPVEAAPPSGLAQGVLAMSHLMGQPVPDDFLARLLGSRGPENASGYANPAFDAAVANATAVTDAGARAAAFQQAERLALADLPIVPVVWERQLRVVHTRQWSGLGMNTFGEPTLRSIVPRA